MNTKKVCLLLDEDLVKKIKILAINNNQTFSNVVSTALLKMLKEHEAK